MRWYALRRLWKNEEKKSLYGNRDMKHTRKKNEQGERGKNNINICASLIFSIHRKTKQNKKETKE